MKKIILSLALASLCAASVFSQRIPARVQQLIDKNAAFRPVAPLNEATPESDNTAIVRNACYARIDLGAVDDIAASKYPAIALSIPYNGATVTMLLYRVEVVADGFHVDTDKQQDIPYAPGAYYRGIIKDNPASVAAFSFFGGEMYGIASAADLNNLVVGKLKVPGNFEDYIVYSDKDLIMVPEFQCGAGDSTPTASPQPGSFRKDGQTDHCVAMYYELRHNIFLENGSDTTLTANWMTALFNNVQALFDNDGITIALKSMHIWSEPDPYEGPTLTDYLSQFYAYRTAFDGDAGQLLNGGFGGGLARAVGALCTSSNMSYAGVVNYFAEVPVYSASVSTMAHELGHTLGSQHTHGCYWNGNDTAIDGCGPAVGYVEGDCEDGPIPPEGEGGTIMSYCSSLASTGINFANGFGPQPAERIAAHVESSPCLGTDCIITCINSIRAIHLTDTTTGTASLSWDDDMAGPWETGYAPFGAEITNWQQTGQPATIIEGLNANSYYVFGVRPVCIDGMIGGEDLLVFSTGADWCSGDAWTDTGGPAAGYPANQRTVTIIKPQNAGEAVTVTFDEFATHFMLDHIYVYDGPGTSAPLLGSASGYIAPPPFTATNPDGALTFEFVSNPYSPGLDGWSATVECTLGNAGTDFFNLAYYPNPVDSILTVANADGITAISVYNVAGQLLAWKKIDGATGVMDMSGFSAGIYLVKVANGDNLKILKIVKE